MTEGFKVGDLVQLKSGGPAMTVEQVGAVSSGHPQVWCAWFIDEKVERSNFPPDALAAASPDEAKKAYRARQVRKPDWVA